MPSRPDQTHVEERFREVAAQLRAARPQASPALRERVRAVAAAEPEPGRRPARLRRAPLVLAPLALVAAVAAFAVVGGRDGAQQEAVPGEAGEVSAELRAQPESDAAGGDDARTFGAPATAQEESDRDAALAEPDPARLQDYRAELRVRVDDLDALSERTSEAMRETRRLGGHVVTARFEAPDGPDGDSLLVVRVPIERVQEAIARFSELGTLVGQRLEIEDLQPQADQHARAIEALRARIGDLERELQGAGLTDAQRAELRRQLAEARANLAARTRARDALERQAATARIELTLTTRGELQAVPAPPGRFEGRLRDAVGVLGEVVSWLLAGLIVTSPLLALGGLLALAERHRRRRAETRLLARS
jgi:hypothetical protein